MESGFDLKAVLVLAPILGLLAIGLFITLRSGVADLWTQKGAELFAGNLSQVAIRLVGYLIGLLALQRFLGAPFEFSL